MTEALKGNLARNKAAEDALLHAILAANDVGRKEIIMSQKEMEVLQRYFNGHKLVIGAKSSRLKETRTRFFRAVVGFAKQRHRYKSVFS